MSIDKIRIRRAAKMMVVHRKPMPLKNVNTGGAKNTARSRITRSMKNRNKSSTATDCNEDSEFDKKTMRRIAKMMVDQELMSEGSTDTINTNMIPRQLVKSKQISSINNHQILQRSRRNSTNSNTNESNNNHLSVETTDKNDASNGASLRRSRRNDAKKNYC